MAAKGERRAWLEIVKPKDLDSHMKNVGQAEANATLVRDMLEAYQLDPYSGLLVHGCGTCQMFDYLKPEDLGDMEAIKLTFADFSPRILRAAQKRLKKLKFRYQLIQDDLENSQLREVYENALLVLVLQHIDWRKGLENLDKLGVSRFYIIEQEQTPGTYPITTSRKLPKSMREYAESAELSLVSLEELDAYMRSRRFELSYKNSIQVPDNKSMVSLVYSR